MAKVTKKTDGGKPAKPYKDFPLFAHATGRWAKKVRGRLHYFGPWRDPAAALNKWLAEKDDLLAGRTPRAAADGLTVKTLVNAYLTAKKHQVETREITQRHFDDLYSTYKYLIQEFGLHRRVDDLRPTDFESLRGKFAKTRGAWALGSQVQRVRSLFKYAFESGLIDTPVRVGPMFKRPSKAAIRRERADKGPNLIEAADLRLLVKNARPQLRAMILLALNCGYGNTDVGRLPITAVDLKRGLVEFARPKTGVPRRCPLWRNTIDALDVVLQSRREPKDEMAQSFLFLTKYGQPWGRDAQVNPVSAEFRKLLVSLDLHRNGIGFYTLRHIFATVGGGTRDQVAVNAIMGHVDSSMSAHYREKIEDSRLRAVTNHVHRWLFPPETSLTESMATKNNGKRGAATKAVLE